MMLSFKKTKNLKITLIENNKIFPNKNIIILYFKILNEKNDNFECYI